MKRNLSAVLAMLSMFSYVLVYAQTVAGNIAEEIVRFHIIANSDSDYDQRVKLDVRDYVSEKMTQVEAEPYSQEYAKAAEQLANERLAQLSTPYYAKARFERVYIPQKRYKNITLPSGRYNAIRLVLGNGAGQNWWCVAYPPLCFAEELGGELSAEGEKKLKENMTKEEFEMITSDADYRLWIVDVIGRITEKIS